MGNDMISLSFFSTSTEESVETIRDSYVGGRKTQITRENC